MRIARPTRVGGQEAEAPGLAEIIKGVEETDLHKTPWIVSQRGTSAAWLGVWQPLRIVQPIATAASLIAATRLTLATVNKAVAHPELIGMLAELTRKQRGRVPSHARCVEILNEGMDLPGEGR